MKKLIVLFAGLFMMTIAVQNVNGQNFDIQTTPASALIISPIAISLTNDGLNFGTLVPTATDGTVTVPPTGARSSVDVDFIDQAGSYNAAAYNVTGQINYKFAITLPGNDAITIKNEDDVTMAINNFTASLPLTDNTIASGGTPFTVGATLTVAGNQAPGLYEGEFDVRVDYE